MREQKAKKDIKTNKKRKVNQKDNAETRIHNIGGR